MQAAAKDLGCGLGTISAWRVGGNWRNGKFVHTSPAKLGAWDSRMGNMMGPSGPPRAPPACGSWSSFFHVGGPTAY